MEKVQATNLRAGMVVDYQGTPHRVMSFTHRTPGKGNAVVQAKLRNVRTGIQTETRLGSTETMERLSVEGREMEYLYDDGTGLVFMDTSNYEQVILPRELIEDELPWLEPNIKIVVQYIADEAMGIELPKTVDIEVTMTEPPMKGATASASPKPATLANGVVIKVPQFIESGEFVRVDPTEARYIERVK